MNKEICRYCKEHRPNDDMPCTSCHEIVGSVQDSGGSVDLIRCGRKLPCKEHPVL